MLEICLHQGEKLHTSNIIDSSLNDCLQIIIHFIHLKLGQIRLESDFGELLAFGIGSDFCFSHLAHVARPSLFVFLFALLIGRLEGELSTKDITKFRTIAVTTTSDLFLLIVVVGRGKKVTEDQFGNEDFLFLSDC